MRFCNLLHGWALGRLEKPEDREQFEYELTQPLPRSWHSKAQPKPTDLTADREAFLALDQAELH